ncbi:hypothetical protein IKO18_02295 [bacterium]|nr:hypothetical protein [bacterium]
MFDENASCHLAL